VDDLERHRAREADKAHHVQVHAAVVLHDHVGAEGREGEVVRVPTASSDQLIVVRPSPKRVGSGKALQGDAAGEAGRVEVVGAASAAQPRLVDGKQRVGPQARERRVGENLIHIGGLHDPLHTHPAGDAVVSIAS
jgi:hypothetical protein